MAAVVRYALQPGGVEFCDVPPPKGAQRRRSGVPDGGLWVSAELKSSNITISKAGRDPGARVLGHGTRGGRRWSTWLPRGRPGDKTKTRPTCTASTGLP
jgi:hypothetical protein